MRAIGWLALGLAGCGHGSVYRVQWEFQNTVEGHAHETRLVVEVDGQRFAESDPGPQEGKHRFDVALPPGEHDVRIAAWANYGGTWEERTVANNYSVDCVWTGRASPGDTTRLVFDIDVGTSAR